MNQQCPRCKTIHSLFCFALVHLYCWFLLNQHLVINCHCIKVLASSRNVARQVIYKIEGLIFLRSVSTHSPGLSLTNGNKDLLEKEEVFSCLF